MPARAVKKVLNPHKEFIIDLLARFRTDEDICLQLLARGVEVMPEDLAPFHAGKYPKMISKRSRDIVATLPIMRPEFRLMKLNDIMTSIDAPSSDQLSAMRVCMAMLKKEDIEESAEDLLRGAE